MYDRMEVKKEKDSLRCLCIMEKGYFRDLKYAGFSNQTTSYIPMNLKNS